MKQRKYVCVCVCVDKGKSSRKSKRGHQKLLLKNNKKEAVENLDSPRFKVTKYMKREKFEQIDVRTSIRKIKRGCPRAIIAEREVGEKKKEAVESYDPHILHPD